MMISRALRFAPWLLLVACGGSPPASDDAPAEEPARGFEPPVITNPESPVRYPPALFQQNVEGTVVLHLFVDSTGKVAPESTRIAEGSGNATLDSAALTGVTGMRFAPARRDGVPVPAAFLQPVTFRHPSSTPSGEAP
jgi:TonB family protein